MYNSGQNLNTIKSFLQDNGYTVVDCGNYLQTQAIWRGGKDTQSVTIYPSDNKVVDWVEGIKFDIKTLIGKVLNNDKIEDIDRVMSEKNISSVVLEKSQIKQRKIFDKGLLLHLVPDHSYLIGRGISEETAKLFNGGVAPNDLKGKLRNRYCFVIYNSKNEIVGFTGRTLDKNNKIKWQHIGQKSEWIWPANLNFKIIANTKCVVLVESPLNLLSLWDAGIKNILCLFGAELSLPILNYLLRRNVEKIVVATDNDVDLNGGVGIESGQKIKKKLSRYFDNKNIFVCHPNKKDFNEQTREENMEYFEKLKLMVGGEYFKYE